MIADTMRHPNEITAGDRIASWYTPQHVYRVISVQGCDDTCTQCFAPMIHVLTDAGEVRFPAAGFARYPWSKIRTNGHGMCHCAKCKGEVGGLNARCRRDTNG